MSDSNNDLLKCLRKRVIYMIAKENQRQPVLPALKDQDDMLSDDMRNHIVDELIDTGYCSKLAYAVGKRLPEIVMVISTKAGASFQTKPVKQVEEVLQEVIDFHNDPSGQRHLDIS